ncbi:MAG: isoprenoid biosynthesis glyoxalase ElbB [Prevotellaceae bacterium]|jgi:enhancing lycopene biosynthesis protein 2|nr:isoprenoid biosynthesis glyoxalase ElbB [Prevotellaceae bacterium]
MKKIAVILSGCGVYDGSEIHEATMALLAVKRNGAEYEIYAPDKTQYDVVDHYHGQQSDEYRNVLVEAARIARGNIKPLRELDINAVDAILFPGGFGVAKNLSSYAFKGADYDVLPEVGELIGSMYAQGKPIGAMCIAPILLAKSLGKVSVTIGSSDDDAAKAIGGVGATHVATTSGNICIDKANKVVTAPCYMLNANITNIFEEADKLVKELIAMM